MTRRHWLETLVRVRKVREDAARADAARAEMTAQFRQQAAAVVQVRLDRAEAFPAGTAAGYVAVRAAQAAAARELAEGVAAWRADLVAAAEARDVVQVAARARRTAERLAERAAAAEAETLARTEQNALDEIAGRTGEQQP